MYYDRIGIKETAKRQLTGRMGGAVLVSLLALLLSGTAGSSGLSFIIRQKNSEVEWIQQIAGTVLPLAGLLAGGVFLYVTLVGNVIRTGKEAGTCGMGGENTRLSGSCSQVFVSTRPAC